MPFPSLWSTQSEIQCKNWIRDRLWAPMRVNNTLSYIAIHSNHHMISATRVKQNSNNGLHNHPPAPRPRPQAPPQGNTGTLGNNAATLGSATLGAPGPRPQATGPRPQAPGPRPLAPGPRPQVPCPSLSTLPLQPLPLPPRDLSKAIWTKTNLDGP